MHRFAKLIGIAALISFVPLRALAAEGQSTYPPVAKSMNSQNFNPHFGVIAGLSNPESFKSTAEYGVDAGLQIWTPLSLALEWTGTNTDRRLGDRTESLDRNSILLKGAYHLGGTTPVVRHSYLGLALGPVFDSSAYKGTHSGIGPIAGFDIPVSGALAESQYLTMGLMAKYIFVSGPSPDSFSMNGALKYWF